MKTQDLLRIFDAYWTINCQIFSKEYHLIWSCRLLEMVETFKIEIKYQIHVNLCQKLFFLQNMVRTCCVQVLFWMSEIISVHNVLPRFKLGILMYWTCKFNEQSVVILWVSWCKNKIFWQRFTCKNDKTFS